MGAEAARVLDYSGSGYYGSAAPAEAPYARPLERPLERPADIPADIPAPQERALPKERAKEAAAQAAPAVSLFALFGAVFAGILMILVVLAQISYSEIAGEIVRLNAQMDSLAEQERKLEIEFENAIDMKEVERYARDTLGMSRPDNSQAAIVRSLPVDSAEIIDPGRAEGRLKGLGPFISSLLEYFR